MVTRPVYCEEAAVRQHIGQIRLAVGIEIEGAIESAANEMDGMLGIRYQVPIIVSPNIADQKSTSYWLQSINAMLTAGRLLVSSAAPGSQTDTNNYGKYLIQNALNQINYVVTGRKVLLGALESEYESLSYVGPMIVNQDEFSQVDAFYSNFEPYGFIDDLEPIGEKWPR